MQEIVSRLFENRRAKRVVRGVDVGGLSNAVTSYITSSVRNLVSDFCKSNGISMDEFMREFEASLIDVMKMRLPDIGEGIAESVLSAMEGLTESAKVGDKDSQALKS